MSEEIIDIYNFSELRQRGIDALTKALGPVGMAYFLRQFEPGHGDYTAERGALLADVKLEDFEAYIKQGKQTVVK